MRFKIDWASFSLEENLPFLLCFTLYLRAISKYKPPPPRGAYIRRGHVTEGFWRYEFGGLILGGVYTRRAYFRNFTVFLLKEVKPSHDRKITNLQTFDRSLPPTRHFR